MKRPVGSYAALAALAALAACDAVPVAPIASGPHVARSAEVDGLAQAELISASVESALEITNAGLKSAGAPYRVMTAEWIAAPGSSEAGRTVFARNVGNKQLEADFVPRDERRLWSGDLALDPNDAITFAIDQTNDAVPPLPATVPATRRLTRDQTNLAIRNAMATWDAQTCSALGLTENPTYGLDVGVVAWLLSTATPGAPVVGTPYAFADVQHAGWRDLNFGGGVLGVTFTFVFTDEDDQPTDVDKDGKADVSLREIYYDPSPWVWVIDAPRTINDIDVQSIALHESGHGLSQEHFGQIFLTANGKPHWAPLAVMNAGYTFPLRTLQGSDNGGHCSMWASWPNRSSY